MAEGTIAAVKRRAPARSGAVVAVLVVLGRAVVASAGSDAINPCAAKKTGVLRLLPAGKECRKREVAIGWNASGPPGTPGPPGLPGSNAQYNGAAAGGDLTGTYPSPVLARLHAG